MTYFFTVTQTIMAGVKYTLLLFFITLLFSMPLGLVLTYARMSKHPWIRKPVDFFVWVVRGTPLLLQLFFFLYGMPFMPVVGPYLTFSRFTAAALAFAINYSAYFCEIFRGGILAIPKGQYEAAKALGLPKHVLTLKVIIPQMLRVTLPAVTNENITLVKDTALVTAIGVTEILHYAKNTVNTDVNITGYVVAAMFYLAMTYVITKLFSYLEKRFAY